MNWIKVEDRLPESEERVLIIENDLMIEIGYYVDSVWIEDSGLDIRYFVTHWMLLPEPPKD